MISIIIPTLNEEAWLEETLKVLKNGMQKMPYEIIISDGKSTDRTRDIAAKYTRPELIVVHDKPTRQTIAEARNLGASKASGDFLVFIDADVIIRNPDEFFTKVVRHFEQDKKLVALTVALWISKGFARFPDNLLCFLINGALFIQNNLLGIGVSYGEFQMIRRDVFEKLGGYNPKIVVAEDNEFFRRLGKVGRTRIFWSLPVYHSGRRAHKIGWPKLLWLWWSNLFFVTFAGHSVTKEWTPIR